MYSFLHGKVTISMPRSSHITFTCKSEYTINQIIPIFVEKVAKTLTLVWKELISRPSICRYSWIAYIRMGAWRSTYNHHRIWVSHFLSHPPKAVPKHRGFLNNPVLDIMSHSWDMGISRCFWESENLLDADIEGYIHKRWLYRRSWIIYWRSWYFHVGIWSYIRKGAYFCYLKP